MHLRRGATRAPSWRRVRGSRRRGRSARREPRGGCTRGDRDGGEGAWRDNSSSGRACLITRLPRQAIRRREERQRRQTSEFRFQNSERTKRGASWWLPVAFLNSEI